MMEECKEIVARIGQLRYLMSHFRRQIEDMVRALYGEPEATRRFGRTIQAWEALSAIERDLGSGRLQLKDLKICREDRCIDAKKFLSLLDDYYEAFGAKQKMWRELMRCLKI